MRREKYLRTKIFLIKQIRGAHRVFSIYNRYLQSFGPKCPHFAHILTFRVRYSVNIDRIYIKLVRPQVLFWREAFLYANVFLSELRFLRYLTIDKFIIMQIEPGDNVYNVAKYAQLFSYCTQYQNLSLEYEKLIEAVFRHLQPLIFP